jgi:hypothetical protein
MSWGVNELKSVLAIAPSALTPGKALAVAFDACPDQGAVGAVQGHHVGHRPDGDEVQEVLHARGVPALHRDGQEVGDAYACKVLEMREVHLRVDDGVDVRKLLGHLVVIRHDQVDAVGLGRGCGRMGRDAVVAGEDHPRPLGREPFDGGRGDAVAVLEAIGEVGFNVALEAAREIAVKHRRRGHAVTVVIPVDDDLLAGGKRLFEASDSFLHARREDGMLEVVERVARGQELLGVMWRLVAAQPEDAGDRSGQVQLLGEEGDFVFIRRPDVPHAAHASPPCASPPGASTPEKRGRGNSGV